MYGDCIPWTPDSEWTLPSDDDVKNMDDGSTPVTGKLDICSDPWIMTAVSENNKLRSEVGTSLVICDEDAARVAKVWSQEMCKCGLLQRLLRALVMLCAITVQPFRPSVLPTCLC